MIMLLQNSSKNVNQFMNNPLLKKRNKEFTTIKTLKGLYPNNEYR